MQKVWQRLLTALLYITLGSSIMAQNITSQFGTDASQRNSNLYDRNGNPIDTTAVVDASTIPIGLFSWKLDTRFGRMKPQMVDTVSLNFQNTNDTGGMWGEYSYLGNLGAPRWAHVFSVRKPFTPFFFTDVYTFNYKDADDLIYTNTKSPYVNLSYFKHGGSPYGEERFNAYFAMNAGKRIGVGGDIDYTYGRGKYSHQSTAHFNGYLYGYYLGDKYRMHAHFRNNNIKTAENGGITDDRYITDPLAMSGGKTQFSPNNIPTNLSDTWNHNIGYHGYLTHSYNLGFYRDREEVKEKDTIRSRVFLPVTSFIHTLKVSSQSRKYVDRYASTYYANSFFGSVDTDENKFLNIQNTFAIALREGFNKWAQAGLTGFIKHDYRRYNLPDTLAGSSDMTRTRYTEQGVSVGGELSRQQGKLLHYRAYAEVPVAGDFTGEYHLEGALDLNFKLFGDTVRLDAKASVVNTTPNFYLRRLHSKRHWWEYDWDKEMRTRIEGELTLERTRTKIGVAVENIKNYTYLYDTSTAGSTAGTYLKDLAVAQESGNIQVISAQLKQDFKLGPFHLDNVVTYQKSSKETVLPLPQLSLYHNAYFKFSLSKKVLNLLVGGDVRYFSKYYAPDYTPSAGQFSLQNSHTQYKVGGYPLINFYANFQLKRTRFFIMYYNALPSLGNHNYFNVPHYPLNPSGIKFGLSWMFFD